MLNQIINKLKKNLEQLMGYEPVRMFIFSKWKKKLPLDLKDLNTVQGGYKKMERKQAKKKKKTKSKRKEKKWSLVQYREHKEWWSVKRFMS